MSTGLAVGAVLVIASVVIWACKGEPFQKLRPKGEESSSVILWIAYTLSWLSQFGPASGIQNLLRGTRFQRAMWPLLDLYVLAWPVAGLLTLASPHYLGALYPLFILRICEYVSIVLYQTLFSGGPPGVPPDYRFGPRSVVVGVVNFLAFVIIFAGIYRAHPECFDPRLVSAREALYFSVVTVATVGY